MAVRVTQVPVQAVRDQTGQVDTRVTQVGVQAVRDQTGQVNTRVTQVAVQVVRKTTGQHQVTQLPIQVLRSPETRPDAPTIVSVTGITGYDALATTSAFSTPHPTATHTGSQYQVQLAGGLWTSIVYDSGDTTDLLSHRVYNLGIFTQYEVRARHKQSNGLWSVWGPSTSFYTNDSTGTPIPFEPTDWGVLWSYVDSYQHGGSGGWTYTNTPTHPSWGGCWVQWQRYLAGSIMAYYNVPNTHLGARVKGSFMAAGCEGGFQWARYYDCELIAGGVAACASGRYLIPSEQTYRPIYVQQPPDNTDYHGVIAYIRTSFMWPYGPCTRSPSGSTPIGTTRGADLEVAVIYNGTRRTIRTYDIPGDFFAKVKSCNRYPFYSVALEVERDFATDPTGKTHLIKAGVREGSTAPDLDDPDQVNIQFTWVGGAEESAPGEGDGGLPCGLTGFYGSRYDQGNLGARAAGFPGGTGWSVFRNFSTTTLQDAPCTPPGEPPDTPPPPPPIDWEDEENPAAGGEQPAPCPDDEPTTALELFMGTAAGQSVQFGRTQLDVESSVTARLVTNHIAPEGFGADYLFTTCYFAFTHSGDLNVVFTPILNGQRLEGEAVTMLLVGDGTQKTYEYKVALSEKYEDSGGTERIRHGLRGQYFAVQLEWIDICGYTQFDGVEVEYERLRESQPGVMIYTEEPFVWPRWAESNRAYFGDATGRMLLAGQTYQDGAADVGVVAKSNLVAPEGVGGECAFVGAYIQVTRSNETVLNLHVTPIVDGVEMGKQTLIYQPTTGDGGPVTEVEEIPITQFWQHGDAIERLRTNPRGTWFQVKVECDTLADGWIVIDGVELDYEAVRESESSIG